MKTPAALATLAFALLTASAPAIDFTPRFTDVVDDGVPMRRMYFSDGAKRIYYRPPVTWKQTSDTNAATFRPKDSSQATVSIQSSPDEHAGIPFDEPGREKLRTFARRLIPSDATDVTPIWEVTNPTVLQGWTSFEIGFDYVHFGQRFCRSVLFINLDAKRQIHFVVESIPNEFPALYKLSYRTLATWWEPQDGNR